MENRKRWRVALAAVAVALVAAATLLSASVSPRPAAQQLLPDEVSHDPEMTVDGDRIRQSPAQLVSEIEAAQQAIATQIGQPPLSGPVLQRPDFISNLEWRVFQGVARTHDNPAAELTLLVNRLRFTRLEDLWRSLLANHRAPRRRLQLARQLLDEIPDRVREHQFDLAQAQALQLQLLEDLVSDPYVRLQQASRESLRLETPSARR